MGAALNTASASNAYVLADRGTWLSFKNRGDLVIAVEGDKRLFNQYGVMLVNPEKHPSVKKDLGQQFIDWLVSPEGQKAHRRLQDQRRAAVLSQRQRFRRVMARPAFCSARGSRDHDGAGDGRGNGPAPRRRQPARRADRGGKGFRSRRSRQGAGEVRRIRPVEGRDRRRRKSGGVRLRQHGAPAGAGRREAQRPCGAVRPQPAVRAGAARPRGHAGRAAGPYARPASEARHLDAEGRSVRRLRLGGFS